MHRYLLHSSFCLVLWENRHSVAPAQAFLVHEMFLDVVVRLGKEHKGYFRLKNPDATESSFPYTHWHGGPVNPFVPCPTFLRSAALDRCSRKERSRRRP